MYMNMPFSQSYIQAGKLSKELLWRCWILRARIQPIDFLLWTDEHLSNNVLEFPVNITELSIADNDQAYILDA